jgi:cytidine deaminase
MNFMKKETLHLYYEIFDSIDELSNEDAFLLKQAGEATKNAYAPYSNFCRGQLRVWVMVSWLWLPTRRMLLILPEFVPKGFYCQLLLLYFLVSLSKQLLLVIAVQRYKSDHPDCPCGICRQSLQEFKERVKQPIRLILGGLTGSIYIIDDASY